MSTDLYSEVRGAGPVLLLIPGGNGDAGFYEPFAKVLSGDFTVVTYDRRGFSRSPLTGPIDDDRLLDIDVDDARTLLKSVDDAPGYVFGSSAGAIVAIHLLTKHPDDVRMVVAHEPPLVRLLPDPDHYVALFEDIYDAFRRRGAGRAMRKFVAAVGFGPPRFGTLEFWRMAKLMPRIRRNMAFTFEHQIRKYPSYQPDTAALQQVSAKLILAGGLDSHEFFPYWATVALAGVLSEKVIDFPGGHIGYRHYPHEFAGQLRGFLAPQRSR
jgi:pimeloyl-ACP methyl ester carboxylesterase